MPEVSKRQNNLILFAWTVSLVATLGSLYFSEALLYEPCKLCWFQRICMYPLVIIFLVGVLENQQKFYKYILSLSTIGWVIAFYHNLLYYNFIGVQTYSCTSSESCTTRFLNLYGFISIPLLSFIAFTLINLSMLILVKSSRNNKSV